jgi:hypothetical protein
VPLSGDFSQPCDKGRLPESPDRIRAAGIRARLDQKAEEALERRNRARLASRRGAPRRLLGEEGAQV